MGIRDLAKFTGVSPHTLRYYERAGLMIRVPRDSRGRRMYSQTHAQWVHFLRHLREGGMSIQQVRAYTKLTRSAADESGDLRQALLHRHRAEVMAKIDRLRQHLRVLDRKLAQGCAPGRDAKDGGPQPAPAQGDCVR